MFLQAYMVEINSLCRKHKVKHLFAFGSVLTQEFSSQSDIDLLVDIDSDDPLDYAENYFELKFGLEQLLKRPIDLLEDRALNNTYLRERIDNSKNQIYGN